MHQVNLKITELSYKYTIQKKYAVVNFATLYSGDKKQLILKFFDIKYQYFAQFLECITWESIV